MAVATLVAYSPSLKTLIFYKYLLRNQSTLFLQGAFLVRITYSTASILV